MASALAAQKIQGSATIGITHTAAISRTHFAMATPVDVRSATTAAPKLAARPPSHASATVALVALCAAAGLTAARMNASLLVFAKLSAPHLAHD